MRCAEAPSGACSSAKPPPLDEALVTTSDAAREVLVTTSDAATEPLGGPTGPVCRRGGPPMGWPAWPKVGAHVSAL